jgi:hypothetical protein
MRILILALVPLLPTAGWPEEEQMISVAGIGVEFSCGQVVAALETSHLGVHLGLTRDGTKFVSEKFAILQYVAGFVTAINLSRGPSEQIQVDTAATELWIRNYCKAHPTDKLVAAAGHFASSQAGEPARRR